MIKTNDDLKRYLAEDSKNYKNVNNINRWKHQLGCDPIADQWYIWKYIYTMRYCEYHLNNVGNNFGLYHKLMLKWYLYKLRKYSRITGFQIPPNTVGAGITIWHWGAIIINPLVRIGDNCTIYPGVLLGHKQPGMPAPQVGNNVFLSSGVKIIGNIVIGNDVKIAPNTVIYKDIPNNCVVAGNPARIIKKDGVKVDLNL